VLGLTAAVPFGASTVTASASTLDEIARCESGGNIRAQNPSSTASGKYQFLDTTWRALGGVGRAKDASEAVQDAMAVKLLTQSGTAPWAASQACWGGKVSAVAPTGKAAPSRPAAAQPARRVVAPQPVAVPGPPGSYTVVAGDTLSGIAAAHGESNWRALWLRNRAAVPNADLIFPGERLVMQ
jgi:nucleoid-associated protein YgaU